MKMKVMNWFKSEFQATIASASRFGVAIRRVVGLVGNMELAVRGCIDTACCWIVEVVATGISVPIFFTWRQVKKLVRLGAMLPEYLTKLARVIRETTVQGFTLAEVISIQLMAGVVGMRAEAVSSETGLYKVLFPDNRICEDNVGGSVASI